jgi:hypothetical protein
VEDVPTNVVSDNLPTDVVSNKVPEYKDTLVIDDENDIPNLQYLDLGQLQHHKKMSYYQQPSVTILTPKLMYLRKQKRNIYFSISHNNSEINKDENDN